MQFPTLVAIAFVFVLCYSTTWSEIEDGRFSAVPISIVGIFKLSFSCFVKALLQSTPVGYLTPALSFTWMALPPWYFTTLMPKP